MIRALRICFAVSGLLRRGCPNPASWQCRARGASVPFSRSSSYIPGNSPGNKRVSRLFPVTTDGANPSTHWFRNSDEYGNNTGTVRVPFCSLPRFRVPSCARKSLKFHIKALCHGRGREFESRRPRHSFEALAESLTFGAYWLLAVAFSAAFEKTIPATIPPSSAVMAKYPNVKTKKPRAMPPNSAKVRPVTA